MMGSCNHCCPGCSSFLHGYERPFDPSTIRDVTPPSTPEVPRG